MAPSRGRGSAPWWRAVLTFTLSVLLLLEAASLPAIIEAASLQGAGETYEAVVQVSECTSKPELLRPRNPQGFS